MRLSSSVKRVWTCLSWSLYSQKSDQLAHLLCRSLGPLIIALIPGKHRYLEYLKRVRQELAKELGEAIDEFGPQIWENFDKVLFRSSPGQVEC